MVGILALQGDFEKHGDILSKLKVDYLYIKDKQELDKTDALIIPGGESTTLSMLIDRVNLRKELIRYSKNKSIFGTCAGMIMLSSTKNQDIKGSVDTLGVMNISVSRNSWGAQIDSFEKSVDLEKFNIKSFNAIFIRAPKITKIEGNVGKVEYLGEEAILIDDGRHLACSFHPELDSDTRVHEYFLEKFYYGRK